jgi:hypothetical protein
MSIKRSVCLLYFVQCCERSVHLIYTHQEPHLAAVKIKLFLETAIVVL